MKKIKIGYSDFWGELIPDDNYFYNLLSLEYKVEIDNENPDILFYTVYSDNHMRYDMSKVIKILYTGENFRPDYTQCHYSLSFDYSDDPRNYRLPLWALILNWFNRPYRDERDQAYLHDVDKFINKKIDPKYELQRKSLFCNFVYTQASGKRVEFFPKLNSRSQYRVISAGRRYNNVNWSIPGRSDHIDKITFLSKFFLTISFENRDYLGYTTEKIIHPMFANSIPVYWGNDEVAKDFNPESFINAKDFECDEDLIDYMQSFANDEDLFIETLRKPWFSNGIPECVQPDKVLKKIESCLT
jgi:hypothetical protein